MNSERPKKKHVAQEIEFYSKRDKSLSKKSDLKAGFLRPVYQYTSLENDTVTKLHEYDYLK